MRPHVPLLHVLAAVFLLAGCSRDLEVPPASTAPVISGISPSPAYAGVVITISGTGFDTAPEGNLVQFAAASARAEMVAADGISLRVPPDAGSGPLTVTTKGGVSAPSPGFVYRGLGELRTGVVGAEMPLLHKPYRVLPIGGDTFLHSDLLLGILRYDDPAFVAADGVFIDSAPWHAQPSVVWLESNGSGSSLVRQSVPGPTYVTTTVSYAGIGPIVAMRQGGGLAADTVAILRQEPLFATTTVELRRLDTFAALPGYTGALPTLAVQDLRGCADGGAGELACLGRQTKGDPLTLVRIHLGPLPSAPTFLAPPASPSPLVEDRTQVEDPLCTDPVARQGVVALQDGTLAVANLATPAFVRIVDTGSRTPARGITCAGAGVVLVSKRGDDLLTAVNVNTPAILWSAPVPAASHSGVDCSAAPPCVVHAAGELDNHVLLLNQGSGALIARRSFDVLPGRVDRPDALLDRTAMQGAAWYEPGAGSPPHLAFATATPRGVIEWPLSAQRAFGLFPHFRDYPDAVATIPWVDGHRYWAVRDSTLTELGFGTYAITGAAQLAVDAAAHTYVATSVGLERLFPGLSASDIPDAEFTSLGLHPDGRIYASVWDGSEATVRAWTDDEAAAGDAAGQVWNSPWGLVASSAVLDGALWAFYWDASSVLNAVELDDTTLAKRSETPLSDAFYSILAVSPNGRTFVSWDFQPFSRDTSLVVWSVAPAAGFPRRSTIPVAGQISGAAFDGTGEKLYVTTRGPDRIVVLE